MASEKQLAEALKVRRRLDRIDKKAEEKKAELLESLSDEVRELLDEQEGS